MKRSSGHFSSGQVLRALAAPLTRNMKAELILPRKVWAQGQVREDEQEPDVLCFLLPASPSANNNHAQLITVIARITYSSQQLGGVGTLVLLCR